MVVTQYDKNLWELAEISFTEILVSCVIWYGKMSEWVIAIFFPRRKILLSYSCDPDPNHSWHIFQYIKFPVNVRPRTTVAKKTSWKIMKCKQQHSRSLLPFVIIMQTHCAAVVASDSDWIDIKIILARHQEAFCSFIHPSDTRLSLAIFLLALDFAVQWKCKCLPQANVNTQKERQTIDKFLSSTKINSSCENAFSPFTFQFVKKKKILQRVGALWCKNLVTFSQSCISPVHVLLSSQKKLGMQQLRHDDDDDVALANDEIIQHGAVSAIYLAKVEKRISRLLISTAFLTVYIYIYRTLLLCKL